jgi:hypothetical protein
MEWRNRWSAYFVQPERLAAGVTCGITVSVCYKRFSSLRSKPLSRLDWLNIDVRFLSGSDID